MPTIHIHHAICYYYSARKLMLIYHPKGVEGQVDLSTKGAQPMPKAAYRSGRHDKHNCPR